MPYDEQLALRIREFLRPLAADMEEKKMFGGLCWMYKGKMSVGVSKDELMTRVVSEKYEKFLSDPNVWEMNFTGKVMKDFLFINPAGFETEAQLADWLNLGIEHAELKAES